MKTILLDSSLPQDWLLGGRGFVVNSSAGHFALDINSFRLFFAARLSLLSCYNSFEFSPYPGANITQWKLYLQLYSPRKMDTCIINCLCKTYSKSVLGLKIWSKITGA